MKSLVLRVILPCCAKSVYEETMKRLVASVTFTLLLLATTQAADGIETKATGGYISSVQKPPRSRSGECENFAILAPGENPEEWCNATFVHMKIDAPVTANYAAQCKAFDRTGNLLGEGLDKNPQKVRDTARDPLYWHAFVRLDKVHYEQVARVECQALRK